MKYILSAIIIFSGLFVKAQMIGLSSGFSYYGDIYIDTHYQAQKGPGYKLSFEAPLITNKMGKNFTKRLDWNEYPDQFIGDGYQYTSVNVGIGKYFESLYLLGIVGLSKETYFRNYYDGSGFYGDKEGYYFQKKHSGIYPNYGGELGLIYYGVLSGIKWTNYGGWAGTFGYVFFF